MKDEGHGLPLETVGDPSVVDHLAENSDPHHVSLYSSVKFNPGDTIFGFNPSMEVI